MILQLKAQASKQQASKITRG